MKEHDTDVAVVPDTENENRPGDIANMDLYLLPFVPFKLGLPIITSSLPPPIKSYEPEVSKQLNVLLHRREQMEEPFRFFKYTYYAYRSWLDSISKILSVENPSEDLFDRTEWSLSCAAYH
jgi:hypothetical protein